MVGYGFGLPEAGVSAAVKLSTSVFFLLGFKLYFEKDLYLLYTAVKVILHCVACLAVSNSVTP